MRLIGVDTPEQGRCYGTPATRFTRRRLEGRRVGYELGPERTDRYELTLAYLYRGRAMHNLDLVADGFAQVLTIPPNDKYAGRLRAAERRARRASRGQWGICRRRARTARIQRARARQARAAAQRRREATRLRRQRDRERRQTPPAPAAPDTGADGGGGGGGGGGGRDNFNIPGIPGD